MEAVLGFLLGIAFTFFLTKGIVKIELRHTHENVMPKDIDMEAIEKTIFEPQKESDKLYEEMGKIQSIFEGSDRE